jgi:DNA-binding transcriptional LysR family regulator
VTPSAVSHRIKNLEELWGDDLFVRSNAALRLTAAGTRYQRNVQDALKSLNELARPEYNKLRTRLRVAIPPTFGRQHLVPRLPEFTALSAYRPRTAPGRAVPRRQGRGHRYRDPLRHRPLPRPEDHELLVEPVFPACGREYYERVNAARSPSRGPAQSDAAAQPAGTVAAVVRNRRPGLARAADWRAVQRYRPDAGGHRLEPGRGLVRQRMARQWLAAGQMVKLLDIESVSPHGYYIVEREQAPLMPEARYFIDWLLGLDW